MLLIKLKNTNKLLSCNYHPLAVVSRSRDPQLRVSENNSDLIKNKVHYFEILLVDVIKNDNKRI